MIHPTNRTCSICKETKPLEDFHRGSGAFYCKPCKKRYAKENYNYTKRRESGLISNYNITLKDFEELKTKQNGVCALCSSPEGASHRKPLYVDHNHSTGEVRGLLCNRCNSLIGMCSENIGMLNRAIEYLSVQN